MPQRYSPPCPPEFLAEAVRLVRESGRPVRHIAEELGVSTESLHNWTKRPHLDEGRRSDGLTSDEREELRRLRRENRVLREDREILKKAASFFATGTRPSR